MLDSRHVTLGAPASMRSGAIVAFIYLGLAAVVLWPLQAATVPVLMDYPNHLARAWLMSGDNAASGTNYVVHWLLIPNLALELMIPFLGRWMAVEQAGRVFIAMAMLLPVLGTITLRRALWGRVGLWPLASFLFVYNAVLQWGFLNFLFALGVAILLFSAWIGSARWAIGWRLLIFAPCAAGLFVLHLFAFGIYGLLVGAYEIGIWLRRGDWSWRTSGAVMLAGMQFLPAIMLWLLSAGAGGPRYTAYGDLSDKLYGFSAPMGFGILGPLLGFTCFPLAYLAWRARALRVKADMAGPILVLLLVAMAMPNWLMGSWQADIRIPVVFPFILIAASQPAVGRKLSIGITALAMLVLGARVWALQASWADTDRQFSEFRAAARIIPRGVRLLVVQSEQTGTRPVPGITPLLASHWNAEYIHMPMLAIIDRDAFVPYLFTGWTTIRPAARHDGHWISQGMPVTETQLRDALEPEHAQKLEALRGLTSERPYWGDWPKKFDFVLWIDFGQKPSTLRIPLQLMHAGSFFRLYRVIPP